MLSENDIQVGKTYRAKKPTRYFYFSVGEVFNDRTVLWISPDRTKVQYDGPAVKMGRHYPTVPMDKFVKWAGQQIQLAE